MGNIFLCLLFSLALMHVPANGRSADPHTYQRALRNVDPGLIRNLLFLDCSPPLSGPSGYGGNSRLPGPGRSRCHLWVDQSGYCRINWSHIVTPSYCRDAIGRDRYLSLPRYGPGEAGAPDWDGGPPEGK